MSATAGKKKLKKLSQKKRADDIVGEIEAHLQESDLDGCHCGNVAPMRGLYDLEMRLREVLDEARNPPPEGDSDGSINRDRFGIYREVENSLRDLRYAIDRAKVGDHE